MKIVSRFLIVMIMAGSLMDLHDLAKLPYLVDHYQQHKQKNGNFSFLEFLNLHYGEKAARHDKEEHEKHKGLPFKSQDCTSAHTLTLISQFHAPAITDTGSVVTYSNYYQSVFTSEFSQSIWQPPRLA